MTIIPKHTTLYPYCEQTVSYTSFSDHYREGLTIGVVKDSRDMCLTSFDMKKATEEIEFDNCNFFRIIRGECSLGFLLYDVVLMSVFLLDFCELGNICQLCIQQNSLFNRIITLILLQEGIAASDQESTYKLEFFKSNQSYCIIDNNKNEITSFNIKEILSVDQCVYSDLFEYADRISREIDYEKYVDFYAHIENCKQILNIHNYTKIIVLDW